jgi:quercetin dioxygenase-like cupin family protein
MVDRHPQSGRLGTPLRSAEPATAMPAIPAAHLPRPAVMDPAQPVQVTELLEGAVPEVRTAAVSVRGGSAWRADPPSDEDTILLFVAGAATYRTRDQAFLVDEETIARAPLGWPLEVEAAPGAVAHLLWVRKHHQPDDLEQLARFPEQRCGPWVRAFRECEAYAEAIKSAETVSRMILPENVVPRVAMGTVETTGPDRVAPHRHPMLEQLFLGLLGNRAAVQADDTEVAFDEATLLHIPLGSNHGASVEQGHRLYYVWMDFFTTREGQVHLQNHEPLTTP